MSNTTQSILFGISIALGVKFGIFAGILICVAAIIWVVKTRKKGWLKRTIVYCTLCVAIVFGVLFGLYGVFVAVLLGCIGLAIARIARPEEFQKYAELALKESERLYGEAKADAMSKWQEALKRFKAATAKSK